MNTVPVMVSTKDLAYLEDMLNWNFIAIKKFNNYLQWITDTDVKNFFNDVIAHYKENYMIIKDCLNLGGNNE